MERTYSINEAIEWGATIEDLMEMMDIDPEELQEN